MNERMMVDPPEGWRYGFPKEVKAYRSYGGVPIKMESWLLANGYPQSEIEKWPEGVPYRIWYEKVLD